MQCSVYGILYIYTYIINFYYIWNYIFYLLYRNEHKIDLKANFC